MNTLTTTKEKTMNALTEKELAVCKAALSLFCTKQDCLIKKGTK